MVIKKSFTNTTYPKTSQVLQSGSQSQMQENFTTGMPNITDVQTNPRIQQSSYVHSSLVHAINTHSQMTQSLSIGPSIMATKGTNSGTQPQQTLQQFKNEQQAPLNMQTCNAQKQYYTKKHTIVPYVPLHVNTNLQQQQSFGQNSQEVNASVILHVKVKQPKAHKQSFLKLMGFTSGQQQMEKKKQTPIQSQQHQYQQQYVPQYAQQGQASYYMPQQQQQPNMHYQPQMQFQQPKVQYQPQMQMEIPSKWAQQNTQYQNIAVPQQNEKFQNEYMPDTPITVISEHQQPFGSTIYRK